MLMSATAAGVTIGADIGAHTHTHTWTRRSCRGVDYWHTTYVARAQLREQELAEKYLSMSRGNGGAIAQGVQALRRHHGH